MKYKAKCRICMSEELSCFSAREMFFGTREVFEYAQCGDCGSVQISEIPKDLRRYYPDDYYSMNGADTHSLLGRIVAALQLQRDRHVAGRASLFGGVLAKKKKTGDLSALVAVGAKRTDSILDVGCGAAASFLQRLALLGFTNLTGADPFISSEQISYGSVKIEKKTLAEIDGQFDIVMLNHSFEHMPDPHAGFREIDRILAPGGTCIIRIPTPSSEAYERYGADWVQLDAPRHLNLPSRKGIELLARDQELRLIDVIDDSFAFQFVGSEYYKRDIPLVAPRAQKKTVLNGKKIAEFETLSDRLNRNHRGDQAAFILRK